MMIPQPPLLVITDRRSDTGTLLATVTAALDGGARWILYRDPAAAPQEKLHCASELRRLTRQFGAQLYISHDAALAESLDADGLHLKASQSLPEARAQFTKGAIGQSCHGEAEIARAVAGGADYVSFSPIFETASKAGYGPALGPGMLKKMASAFPLPIIALGGIHAANAAETMAAGAKAVAIMGAIMASAAPSATTREIVDCLLKG